MEFYENKAKTPFIRLVQLWQAAANADPTSVTADE